MTKAAFRALSVGALLCLCACQVSKNPDGSTHIVIGTDALRSASSGSTGLSFSPKSPYPFSPALYARTEDSKAAATLLVQAFNKGGMAEVVSDIQRCYAAANYDQTHGLGRPGETRFCVAYDGIAYRIDNTVARRHGWGRTPYFEPEIAARRWSSHVYDAGFGRVREIDDYMRKSAALAQPFLPAQLYLM